MSAPQRGRDGFFHPSGEPELIELVRIARRRRLPVRVRGSGHSVEATTLTTPHLRGEAGAGVDIRLDRYAGFELDRARGLVTAEAGCPLGADPRSRDGAGSGTGLCRELDERGWALPVTAGVTHQTVAGFIATGSAGGSRRHALLDQIVAIRLIDGAGEVREIGPEDGDLFDAAGVSLGLLGVISTVTLRCVERFEVKGSERVVAVERAPFAAFADGAAGVDGFLERSEYGRVYWWPQRHVEKMTVWSAARADDEGPARPYRQLPDLLGSQTPAQAVAGTFIAAACRRRRWSRPMAAVYNRFIAEAEPQRFRDAWWRTIPMDDELDERFFPSTYCELWLDADATGEAMRRLRDHYRRWGFAATGGYTVEIYAAPASRFWLSPAYGRDSTRLNFCWHQRGRGDPVSGYFPQFLDLLDDLDPRPHWAKHLYADPGRTAKRVAASYPHLKDFLALREQLDPDGIFLNDYWRAHLGLVARSRGAVMASDGGRSVGVPARRRPLLFKLKPSDESFIAEAPHVIDVSVGIEADPEAVLDGIVNLVDANEWLPDFLRADWIEGPDADGRQLVEETFKPMTQRVRTLRYEPGRHWVATVEACTLPLGRRLLEEITIEPDEDGGATLRWLYCYEPPLLMRPLRRILHAEFEKTLRLAVEQLDRHLTSERSPA